MIKVIILDEIMLSENIFQLPAQWIWYVLLFNAMYMYPDN